MSEQTQELGFSLADYFVVLRRRWLGATLVALLTVLAAVWLAWALPATYQSQGTVLVERVGIPEGLVNSTVTGYAQERIENIKRQALTRERLIEMADRHELFSDSLDAGDETTAVAMMRQSLLIELLNVEQNQGKRGGQSKVVIAFTVAFQADKAEVAQAVVTEVMKIFLEENQALRIAESREVVGFFDRNASVLQAEIDAAEQKISQYKQSNSDSLPNQMTANRRRLSELEQELVDFSNRERGLRNLRSELTVQLDNMDPHYAGVGSGGSRLISPVAQLAQAKSELATARERYSAIHPEIGRLEMLIAGLDKEVGQSNRDQSLGVSSPTNAEYLRTEAKLKSIEVDLSALTDQRKVMRSDISNLEVSIAGGPEVERELRALSIELDSSRKQYREMRDTLLDARLGEDLEIDQKGGGFRVLESADLPKLPISPDRPGIVALGCVAAMFLALLWLFVAEFLDRSVRGQRGVMQITGIAPIAVIPNMSAS